MSVEQNKRAVIRVFEEAFNRGELGAIDEVVAPDAVDRQHSTERGFRAHLKDVVTAMRAAFPDLNFEISRIIGEGDWVALHSVMTGTNTGPLRKPLLSPDGPESLPPTGRAVRTPHMHLLRFENGLGVELFHIMDSLTLLGQLGLLSNDRSEKMEVIEPSAA